MAGIVGYGAFIPRNRIKAEEIARQWGKDPAAIRRGLLLEEKSVPGLDEDTITISVEAGRVEYAMGIGADTSQGAPNDALEYSASAGGAAYLFGKQHVLAEVVETYSYTTDTPDFWRREGEVYPPPTGP